jgi:hypothetical protein
VPDVDPLRFEEVQAFVGGNARDFWDEWGLEHASRSWSWGFLLPAAIFNISWLVYRKLYVEAVAVILFVNVLSFVLVRLGLHVVNLAFAIGLGVVLGFTGSGLYLRKTRRAILAARREAPDVERRLVLLRARGGVSVLWLLVSFVVRLALSGAFR